MNPALHVSGMPKISDERRAERRAQILDAARRCFHGQGLHATSMADIIKASGLSAGAVYGYFASKEDLILATVTSALDGLRELFSPLFSAPAPATPSDLVLAVLKQIDAYSMREDFDFRRIALLGWAEAQRNESVRAQYQQAYGEFRQGLAQVVATWPMPDGVPGSDTNVARADAILAVVLGYVVEATVLGDVSPDRIAIGLAGLNVGDDMTAILDRRHTK
jgi:TetR/AcrR family transcriptional regulator, transcriptional repressor of aconitase